jgi:hypothetical protein
MVMIFYYLAALALIIIIIFFNHFIPHLNNNTLGIEFFENNFTAFDECSEN